MSIPATPEEIEKVRQLREELAREINAMMKASSKEDIRETITGLMEQSASVDQIMAALDPYFVSLEGEVTEEESPEEGPALPEAPAEAPQVALPPEGLEQAPSREDDYMAAARRNMA